MWSWGGRASRSPAALRDPTFWWQADPTTGTVMIFLTHNMFDLEQLMRGIGLGAFAAVEQFHALASAM